MFLCGWQMSLRDWEVVLDPQFLVDEFDLAVEFLHLLLGDLVDLTSPPVVRIF